jgi:hypothetical protein
MWSLHRKVILTKDNLNKRNWQGNTKCSFCDHDETIQSLNALSLRLFGALFTWRSVSLPKNISNLFGSWLHGVHKIAKHQSRSVMNSSNDNYLSKILSKLIKCCIQYMLMKDITQPILIVSELQLFYLTTCKWLIHKLVIKRRFSNWLCANKVFDIVSSWECYSWHKFSEIIRALWTDDLLRFF